MLALAICRASSGVQIGTTKFRVFCISSFASEIGVNDFCQTIRLVIKLYGKSPWQALLESFQKKILKQTLYVSIFLSCLFFLLAFSRTCRFRCFVRGMNCFFVFFWCGRHLSGIQVVQSSFYSLEVHHQVYCLGVV